MPTSGHAKRLQKALDDGKEVAVYMDGGHTLTGTVFNISGTECTLEEIIASSNSSEKKTWHTSFFLRDVRAVGVKQ
jgi:hypothetical protein